MSTTTGRQFLRPAEPLGSSSTGTPGAPAQSARRHPGAAFDLWCLRSIARWLWGVPLRLQLWDGRAVVASQDPPVATVIIHDRATLVRLVASPDLAFGEGYMSGRLEVAGDLVALCAAISRHLSDVHPLAGWIQRHVLGNGVGRARRNVHHHYDLGNEFYRHWLDREMVYTCAYFSTPTCTLEEAQTAKMEHVARKLALRPGELVYEAGCGWGALAIHLARHHGVRVRAWNLSREQIAWARDRASREELGDRVEFVEDDYRRMEGTCDAFVSVGMLEHVGARHYTALGAVIDRCLHPGHGRGLLHFIGRNRPAPMGAWISRYIFPGAYLPSLGEVLHGVIEPFGMSVTDAENLRLHYARTLAMWHARFEGAVDTVRTMFDERFVRMWRLYLASAEAGFLAGNLQLFQVTFARAFNNEVPLTREALYR